MKEIKKQHLLAVSIRDLQMAYRFSSHLLKNNLFMYPYSRTNGRYLEQTCYTLSLIVSYARPFSISQYEKVLGEFCDFNDSQKILHRKIITYRNEIFAHSNLTRYKFKYFTDTQFGNIENTPFMRIEKKENVELRQIIRSLLKRMKAEELRLRKLIYLAE